MSKIFKKHILIYVMYEEFGLNQKEIADILRMAQSTVSHAIRKIDSSLKLQNFDKDIQEARNYLQEQGLQPVKFKLNLQNYKSGGFKNE